MSITQRLPTLSLLLLAVALTSLGFLQLGYRAEQTDFGSIVLGYGLAFAGYAVLVAKGGTYWRWGLVLAVAWRVLLVFAFPTLSDDVYRFIWDGRLLVQGLNPFDHLPGWYLEPGHAVAGLDADLYRQLNSPDYHTIYPPVAQAVFALGVWIFPASWYGSMVVMKLCLLAAEVLSIGLLLRLLPHWQLPRSRVLIYAFNPLIINEVCGNLHFEGMMVCFLLAALYALVQARPGRAGLWFSLSVSSKLLPLMFLPFLLRRMAWRPLLWFSLVLGATLLLFFAPLLSGVFVQNFGSSLDLYFRKFEFNASLYYLAREWGYRVAGFNQIARLGPWLAALAAAAILLLAALERRPDWRSLPGRWLAAILIFLICTTTVHPWYLSLPVVLCVFTRWRFPIVWSALITLTYYHYHGGSYQEQLGLVAVEYGLVALVAVGEWRYHRAAALGTTETSRNA